MGSPIVEVKNGGGSFVDTPGGVDVTNGNTISIQLKTPGGVTNWYLEIFGVDEVTATAPSLTGVDMSHHVTSPSTIVTFVMPAGAGVGRAIIIRSTVDTGGPGQTTTFGIFTLTDEGERVGAVGETFEGNATFGWVAKVNPLIRAAAGGGGGGPVDEFAGLGVTSEHRADSGVEYGRSVSCWRDLRGWAHWIQHERDRTGDPRILEAGFTRTSPNYVPEYDNGLPAIEFQTGNARSMWSRTPLVRSPNGEFSMALRIHSPPNGGRTIFSVWAEFPEAPDANCQIELTWTYTSGPTGTYRLNWTDDDGDNVEATVDATHTAWHTLIIRAEGTAGVGITVTLRVDGSNGTPVAGTNVGFSRLDQSGLACDISPIDGVVAGFFTFGAIRHILTADSRVWSDLECATIETKFTDRWT